MKSFSKVAISAMLAIAPMVAAGTALANTELVPGARLVAPYWDVTGIAGGGGDRSTLFLLVNVSKTANLQRTAVSADLAGMCNLGNTLIPPVVGNRCGVHLEFYDKDCENVNQSIDLSKHDIDQIDLNVDSDMTGPRGLNNHVGWVDIDIRKNDATTDDTSIQANVLMGTVVISDAGSGFAVAYPMAASIGSSSGSGGGSNPNAGIGGDIVSRAGGGFANVWSGGYESFPARVFVPMYFAEGTNNGVAGFTSTLAIAGPAQAISLGEAPGQELGTVTVANPAILVNVSVAGYDACENPWSDSIDEHYIIGTLDELFAANVTAPFNTTGGIGTCIVSSADVDRKASGAFQGGYIDLKNRARSATTTAGVVSAENSFPRGLVGVLVQQTTNTGDATRLWGDCAYGNSTTTFGSVQPADLSNPASAACRTKYSLVDSVNHNDILP